MLIGPSRASQPGDLVDHQRPHAGPAAAHRWRSSAPVRSARDQRMRQPALAGRILAGAIVAAQQDRRAAAPARSSSDTRSPCMSPLAHARQAPSIARRGRSAATVRPPPPSQIVSRRARRRAAVQRVDRGRARPCPRRAGRGRAGNRLMLADDVGEALRIGQVQQSDAEPLGDAARGRARRRPWSGPDRAAARTTDSRLPSLRG